MIHTTPASFLSALETLPSPHRHARPAMAAAMLVSPSAIALSAQAASDNVYMDLTLTVDPERAVAQHLGLIKALNSVGLPTIVFPGIPGQPDGCFLNNAFGMAHQRLILGGMRHPDRQRETQRQDIKDFFLETLGFEMSSLAREGVVAELTGVIVIDRLREIGFLGRSSRVNALGEPMVSDVFGLKHTLAFDLAPEEYHTNMVLSVLAARAAVVHGPSVGGEMLPQVLGKIYDGQVLHLNKDEKDAFAGNCLAVTEEDVFFSETALEALRPSSLRRLEGFGFKVHGLPLDEIEKAGGSLRCLISEVY